MVLLPVAPAYGADLRIAETVDRAGDPGLTAAVYPSEGSTLEWRRCADGGSVCDPLPASAYGASVKNGRVAFPGETPAGIVFEAVATKDGVETKARTRAWQGRLTWTVAPTLQGEAAVGKTVTLAPGTWVGAWGPGGQQSPDGIPKDYIYACREPTGGDCWLIAYGRSVAPGPQWAGWYLFAQEHSPTGNALCNWVLGCGISVALVAPPSHFGPQPGQTAALSAPLGPVAAAPVPAPRVAKPPTASVRARALRRNGELLVGRVSCETRCSVQLKVSGGGRRAMHRTLSVTGVQSLTVPVRHGKLKVRVVVDGKPLASGSSRAR